LDENDRCGTLGSEKQIDNQTKTWRGEKNEKSVFQNNKELHETVELGIETRKAKK
jgi:hypothetical protein